MLNSKDRKIISVVLMLLMVFTSLGAAMAVEESNVTETNTCGDRIVKNVTNLNGTEDTLNYGDVINYTITVKRYSGEDEYYRVNDILPAGVSYINHTITGTAENLGTYNPTTGNWTGIYLDHSSERAILTILAQIIDSCTTINNTARLYSNDNQYGNWHYEGRASSWFYVPCAADLGITKVVNNTSPKLNDNINFAINATNNGPDGATGVTVNDLLPAGLQYVSDDSGGAYNSTTGIWTIGNLANGASALLNIIAKVVLSNVNITNTANVTGCEFDPCLANNTANTTISVPAQSSLYLNITAPTTCIGLNSIQQIIFKVGNYGPDTADYTNVTWVIPNGMEFVNATVDVGTFVYDPATRTITWTIGNVPVGDPFMWLFVRVLQEGNFLVNPTLSTTTYDPTLGTNVQFSNICVQAAGGGEETVAAATVGMQNTGVPIGMLVLALLAVLGGLIVPRRKK
jgi:uncharacterized repeat protein (TIGR01451 family)/fimbrial isopeptide formation D2 family protein